VEYHARFAAVKTLVRVSLAHPRATLAAALAATFFFAAALPRLETAVGYRAFLGEAHPSVRTFDAFLERFEGGLPLAIVYACGEGAPCESVFDDAALAMAREVAGALAAAPGVRRVESPATSTLFVPDRPPLPPRPRRFFENGGMAPDRAGLAVRARADRLWRGALVSEDGRTGAIVVEVAGSEGAAAESVWRAAERALAPHEAHGFSFYPVGGPVEFVVAGGELERAAHRMVPLMVLLVAGGLALLLRSPGATAALLATVGLGVVWTHGLLGWLGWPQNTLTQILAPVVLVIGTCNGLHLIARLAAVRAAEPGAPLRALLQRAADEVGAPCLMMTLTTMGGFLSFATSDLEAFVRFGAAAAFGIGASLLLCFSVLPVLLLRLPPRPAPDRSDPGVLENALVRLARRVERHAGLVLAVAAVVAIVCGLGMLRLRVDATFEDLYGEGSRVVRAVHFVREHLRRPDTLEVEISLPPGADVAAPETLGVLERVSARLAAIPDVGRVRSLLDPLSWANRLATGDDPRGERPAATAGGNRLLLAHLAPERGGPLRSFFDAGAGRARLSLETEKPPQERVRALVAGADAALRAELPEGWGFTLTGPIVLVRDMLEAIQSSQRTSFLQAWATVALLVALFYRSLQPALLVTVSTVLPVLATVGAMGLLRVPLDPGSAMVAAVVLGISDDDAIHLIAQYRRLRSEGAEVAAAVEGALVHSGRALVTTSLSLALGFSTLALSPWRSVASFGLLSALAILVALGAVLIVLPAALYGAARLSSGSASAPTRSS
jgi:predicted RND superfamily exporter protein